MSPMISRWLSFCLLLICGTVSANDVLQVRVDGEARLPSNATLARADTIGQLVSATIYAEDAYLTGAALIRNKYVLYQSARRLLLLSTLKELSLPESTMRELYAQISALKVTGRIPQQFDWDIVALSPAQNRQLIADDIFYVPRRPDDIKIVGAIKAHSVPFVAGKTVADYARAFTLLPDANKSEVWIIFPDTHIEKVGVAYWNQQHTYIAPGSYIYVPLAEGDEKLAEFQQSLRSLLATQILP